MAKTGRLKLKSSRRFATSGRTNFEKSENLRELDYSDQP
jgi:hypothetical protein